MRHMKRMHAPSPSDPQELVPPPKAPRLPSVPVAVEKDATIHPFTTGRSRSYPPPRVFRRAQSKGVSLLDQLLADDEAIFSMPPSSPPMFVRAGSRPAQLVDQLLGDDEAIFYMPPPPCVASLGSRPAQKRSTSRPMHAPPRRRVGGSISIPIYIPSGCHVGSGQSTSPQVDALLYEDDDDEDPMLLKEANDRPSFAYTPGVDPVVLAQAQDYYWLAHNL